MNRLTQRNGRSVALWLALLAAVSVGCGESSEDSPVEFPIFDAGFDGGRFMAPVTTDGAVMPIVDAGPRGSGFIDAAAQLDAAQQTQDAASDAGGATRDAGGSDGGSQMASDAASASDAEADAGGIDAGKFVGNITTNGQVRSDFVDFWNQITPENEGKWGSVEGVRNQMNWGGLDRAHDYAKQHGVVFKQHCFVWGSQQPGWLSGLSASDQRTEVEEWIRLYCGRYPDTALIDVVNEPPPHTTPVYMNALGGAGASGYDWIVQAFEWAHQYCPNATLILNDYNNIEYSGDSSHFIDIAKRVKAAGAPIHAVGAQAHDAYKLPAATVKNFIDQLASGTGLPVYITEYDLNLSSDSQQAQVMQEQFTMFWNHEAIAGITLWGYIEGATWRPNTGLMSSSGNKRPAMTWLMDFLGR